MLRFIKKKIGKLIRLCNRICYRFVPVNDKMVLFIAFHGRGYSDNPKAIHQYMLAHDEYKDYTYIWAIKHKNKFTEEIPNAKIIEYFSIPYFWYLARCKYWVVNCKLPKYVLKKKNQVYLQTWHGTPLKHLAHDIEEVEGVTYYRSGIDHEAMCRSYDNDVVRYNYMISPSIFTTEVFQTSFRINRERLIETGYPRNDILTNYTQEDIDYVMNRYHIPEGKKIVLYAPTWRDNSFVVSGYTFKLEVDFRKWHDVLGDDYVVLFKPHYLIINDFDLTGLEDFVIQVPATDDISKLYVASDMLITDYSSVFFDYGILKRPIYFYMYDIEEYRDQLRGFYLDIYKDLPGVVYDDESKMLDDIHNNIFDYSKLKEFNARFNNNEDGHASERVCNIVFGK